MYQILKAFQTFTHIREHAPGAPVGVEPISSAVMVSMMVYPAALRLGFDHALTIMSNNQVAFCQLAI
jgi:hypothetical protein